ncbi:hypothetical protein [uncultured Psychrobacter sp.]|nr:hypothetical protein [uncultured Psychrobacter sp.]
MASITLITCVLSACSSENTAGVSHHSSVINNPERSATAAYQGTASVTQGEAMVDIPSLYECENGRNAPIGHINSTDGKRWTVPAEVNFTNSRFPFAHDLNNPCTGVRYASATEARNALDPSDIIEIDADGDVITAYIFADNYFEIYINGVPVGKDSVPFTQFNSSLVQFKVKKPFTVAMKLVDWEENSGIGSESNQGQSYYPGDGGVVAVFMNTNNEIIAKTNDSWKAQTFYTAPIRDLSCVAEKDSLRLTTNCSTEGSDDGSQDYALHWSLPNNWYAPDFNDSAWPSATVFTNDDIGVNNKSAYTDFVDIFDDSNNDARFIWSTNVILDNEVIIRHTVD